MKTTRLKERLLLVIALVGLNQLYAQDMDQKFQFGLSISPKLTLQKFEKPEFGDSNNKISFSINANLYYKINSKIQIQSGIGISEMATSQLDYFPIFGCDLNSGEPSDLYNSYYQPIINTVFVGIPLNLRFKFAGDRNSLFFDLGAQNNFQIVSSERVEVHECGIYVFDMENNFLFVPNKYLLTLNGGMGFELKLPGTKSIFIEPIIEIALTKTFENVGISTPVINNSNIRNIGLALGIKF